MRIIQKMFPQHRATALCYQHRRSPQPRLLPRPGRVRTACWQRRTRARRPCAPRASARPCCPSADWGPPGTACTHNLPRVLLKAIYSKCCHRWHRLELAAEPAHARIHLHVQLLSVKVAQSSGGARQRSPASSSSCSDNLSEGVASVLVAWNSML